MHLPVGNEPGDGLLDRLQREGEVFVSQAVIHGRFALRACIVNFHTELADVEATVAIAVRVGREIYAASPGV